MRNRFSTSIALPAFILGHDPTKRIIVVSNGLDLAAKLGGDIRSILSAPFYKAIVPGTRISRNKNSELEVVTRRQCGRPYRCDSKAPSCATNFTPRPLARFIEDVKLRLFHRCRTYCVMVAAPSGCWCCNGQALSESQQVIRHPLARLPPSFAKRGFDFFHVFRLMHRLGYRTFRGPVQ
jgi:hypothetical protein